MQRIVVGVDGSSASRMALAWAVGEAVLRQAKVQAVHAWHYPYVGGTGLIPVPIDTEAAERWARDELDAAVDAVDASSLPEPIERQLVRGGPGATLLAEAEGADLLVVGTRGRGGFAGLLLGSVSQQVTHHAPCPVVIIPAAR